MPPPVAEDAVKEIEDSEYHQADNELLLYVIEASLVLEDALDPFLIVFYLRLNNWIVTRIIKRSWNAICYERQKPKYAVIAKNYPGARLQYPYELLVSLSPVRPLLKRFTEECSKILPHDTLSLLRRLLLLFLFFHARLELP